MTSAINPLFPVEGNPTTKSVRDNFAAAKNEIEAVQTGKQNTLESGVTIKTIVGKDPLGAGNLTIDKNDVGLANVDNTSDANKPVSTLQSNAINAAASSAVTSAVTQANGYTDDQVATKQDTLQSTVNIKSIMKQSVVGAGDLQFPTIQDILTAVGSVRGVAHRGGWPNSTQSGQIMGASMWPVEAGSDYQIVYVGAVTQLETSSRAGTIQTLVECPYGSGNWKTVTFNAVPGGTFITTGSTPDASNNWFMMISDPIPGVSFDSTQMLRVLATGKGGVPTMVNFDGYYEGKAGLEFSIQSSSTNDASLQLASIGQRKVDLILKTIESDGASMSPQVCTAASWAANVLSLTLPSHGISNGNWKLVLDGFVASGATIDGVYSYTTNGANAINVAFTSDPGTISETGIVRLGHAVTAAAWASGVLTLTRAAHGRIEGQVASLRGFSSTGAAINGDFPITSVTTDTYTVALPSDPGTIGFTNAYTYIKYSLPSADFHLRPFTIIANGRVACETLAADSTTQTVDKIQDATRLCGVAQRLVGELFPFVDISANNEGLNHWLASPSQVIIRTKIMELWAQGITMGYSKNDEDAYTNVTDWNTAHDTWWALPVQAALANSGFNFAVAAPTRGATTRDNFTTVDGMIKPNNTRLVDFQRSSLYGKIGALYRKVFNYLGLIGIPNQPYAFKVHEYARPIIFSTIAASAVVSVDPSTPISPEDNGRIVLLPGAAASGGNAYSRIKYISPTKFISVRVATGIRMAFALTTTVNSGSGTIGIRRSVAYDATQFNTLHENPETIATITRDRFGLQPAKR